MRSSSSIFTGVTSVKRQVNALAAVVRLAIFRGIILHAHLLLYTHWRISCGRGRSSSASYGGLHTSMLNSKLTKILVIYVHSSPMMIYGAKHANVSSDSKIFKIIYFSQLLRHPSWSLIGGTTFETLFCWIKLICTVCWYPQNKSFK